ncbi:helicase [Malassezia yamatoensis]|uniref:Nuclear movement protein nudC n=1 Tax=Malassezia yamatoensis TaxID=253288 RepID=A0AAJ5YSQ6_9BASI|nr:helicase [Malassezia yamatoensis]
MAKYSSEAAHEKLHAKFHTPLKRKAETNVDVVKPAPLLPLAHEPSFLCQWRQPQMRKHKTWQGDAILVLHTNRTTCSLRSVHDGKLLVTNAAFRRLDVNEGDELYVGGKEILIEKALTSSPAESDLSKADDHTPTPSIKQTPNSSGSRTGAIPTSQFYATPIKNGSQESSRALRRPSEPHPRYDPTAPGAVVMRRPSEKHQEVYGRGMPVVDVVLDPDLTRVLRPHQIEGVRFMYEAVMGFTALEQGHASPGQGAILADEMGLGKTLQTIAVVMTLLRQSCYYSSVTVGTVEKVLIVCPLTLVVNWKREFRKWVGRSSIGVLAVDDDGRSSVDRFVQGRQYQVLILGYERLRSCAKQLANAHPPIGLVVCDEGHRLKSKDTKTTKCFDAFQTRRRILLTGTPIQNDLREFYSMVDFVYPGMFDNYSVFKRVFEDPIMRSRVQHCAPSVAELGRARSQALQMVTKGVILRRTAEILAGYLPPKHEMVLFCAMSPIQRRMYALCTEFVQYQLTFSEERNYLPFITLLRQLCNAPELLTDSDRPSDSTIGGVLQAVGKVYNQGAARRIATQHSGKLAVLHALLRTIRSTTKDRVIIVSNFTATLDLLQRYCQDQHYPTLRLDGKTKQEARAKLVSQFNRHSSDSDHEPFVFLLSSKSGGVGLNLIGANRLILFDSDWNPSTDRQAMARIHRDGQTKPCYIYRLLLVGAMDEKMYQRQITKIGLSDALVGSDTRTVEQASSVGDSFSQEEIKDIFTLHPYTRCLSHDLLRCPCNGQGTPPPKVSESEQDDILPRMRTGFVSASDVQKESVLERTQRQELARYLGDMRHYDFVKHADLFVHDPILQEMASAPNNLPDTSLPAKEPQFESFLPSQQTDSLFLEKLVEKYACTNVPSVTGHALHRRMSLSAEEYEKLSPEKQKEYDVAQKLREEDEQSKLPYRWTQALDHVEVVVPVPEGTRGKQVQLSLQRTRMRLEVHGMTLVEVGDMLIQGQLSKPIRPDECTWTIDDGQVLNLHLEKANPNEWWAHVLTHDPPIDTTKIKPEDSKLSDLDGETRVMVERMMIENRQKQLHRPV